MTKNKRVHVGTRFDRQLHRQFKFLAKLSGQTMQGLLVSLAAQSIETARDGLADETDETETD